MQQRLQAAASQKMPALHSLSYSTTWWYGTISHCTVVGVDTEPPTIFNCPQSTTYEVGIGVPSRSVSWIEPIATDNSGGQPTVVRSHQPGSTFNVGTTQVTYTFTDQSQNSATCTFAVIGKWKVLVNYGFFLHFSVSWLQPCWHNKTLRYWKWQWDEMVEVIWDFLIIQFLTIILIVQCVTCIIYLANSDFSNSWEG